MNDEKLDPHYFSTTPKSSWELFKWIFTNSQKSYTLQRNLSDEKLDAMINRMIYWLVFSIIILYIIFNTLFVYFDTPLVYKIFFKKEVILKWENINTFYDKFFFIKEKLYWILFIFSTIIVLIPQKKYHYYNLASDIKFRILPCISSIFIIPIYYYLNFEEITPFIISSVILVLVLINAIISLSLYTYPYYMIKYIFIHPTLENNAYLVNSAIPIRLKKLENFLSQDSFNRPILATSFIGFLLEFHSEKKLFAFHLSHIVNASNIYRKKISIEAIDDSIKKIKNYTENQPIENFISSLKELKYELRNYQTQNNIHHKITSIKK